MGQENVGLPGITRRALVDRSTAGAAVAAGTLARPYLAQAQANTIRNPAWAHVRTEHPFNIAIHDVTSGGMAPKDAVGKALDRIDQIFAKYQIRA
jgi:hypothetical protein